jgi:hypothetical protein
VGVSRQSRYALADTFQQTVGGFLLAGPFVVTGEVWELAASMAWYHVAATTLIVFATGYAALYRADDDRDPDREADVVGVPVRFVSLVAVSYLSVLALALAFDAPQPTDVSGRAVRGRHARVGVDDGEGRLCGVCLLRDRGGDGRLVVLSRRRSRSLSAVRHDLRQGGCRSLQRWTLVVS